MDSKKKTKLNKLGFTLAELLVVIVILMILAGVSFVAVNRYIRNLHVLEMDNTAKEIFIVAQNHLSKAYVSGEFERELEKQKKDGTDKANFGEVLSDKPSYITEPLTGDDHEFRYVIYNGNPSGASKKEVLSYMLPDLSIDEEVSYRGNYIIIYDAKSASILGVFYSGNTHTFFGSSNIHPFEIDEAEENSNSDLREAVDNKEKRKHYPDSREDSVIGRYVSGGKDMIPEGKLEPLILRVDNGAKLTATVDNPNESRDSRIITLTVKGKTSGNSQTIVLGKSENSFETSYKNVTGPEDNSTLPKTYTNIGYDDTKNEYTFTLDDITSANGHFCNAFPYLIPGEDVEIYAEISDTAAISTPVESNHESVNSLFDGYYTIGSDDGIAEVKNIRHLENLMPEISNLSLQFRQSQHTDNLIEKASKIKVKKTNQIDDISYSGSGSYVEKINEINAEIGVEDGFSADGRNLTVYKYDGSLLSSKGYYGISNNNLESYDGQGFSIDNVYSETGDSGNTGIFAETDIYDSENPSNFNVKFELRNLKLIGCYFDSTGGSGSAGGFIGSNLGNLEIRNCTFDGNSVFVKANNGNAGGFVGESKCANPDNVSLLKMKIVGGKVTSAGLTISSGSGNCAGLVGHSEVSVDIDDSKIKGNNLSILSSRGGVVGGLVGKGNGAVTITRSSVEGYSDANNDGKHGINCYVTITSEPGESGEPGNAGGILGESAGKININDCYTTGEKFSVTGKDAGGILGASNGGMDIKNTYCSSRVFAKDNAGGFIGNINLGSENNIKWCFAGGHTETGKYVTDPAVNHNIISEKVAGGFIGNTGAHAAKIECSYTTCSVYSSGTDNGFAGGFIGKTTSSLTVSNCYSAGPVSIAEGGQARGFVGYDGNSITGVKNYYLKGKGFNSSFPDDSSGNVSPTRGTVEDILASDNENYAYPWDSSLRIKDSYNGKYPYKTVKELSDPSSEIHPSTQMKNHHGDWTTVEASDISLSISNAEKLAVIISIDKSSLPSGGKYVSMAIDSQGGGTVNSSYAKAYMQFLLLSDNIYLIPKNQALANLGESDPGNVIFPETLNYKIEEPKPGKIEYHIYLDDITTPGGNFASLFKCFNSGLSADYNFKPGEDIRITAESGIVSWDTLIDHASDHASSEESITGITNSLFAPGSGNTNYSLESEYYSDIDKEHIVNPGSTSSEYNKTALILNFRHLQNLDTYISGVADGYKKAKLCDDIWWRTDGSDELDILDIRDKNSVPASKTAFISAIQTANGNRNDISIYAYGSAEPVTVKKAFMGIINDNLQEFDGNKKSINNVFIHNNKSASVSNLAADNADAGLFRYFSFTSDSKIHDLHLIKPTVVSDNGEAGGLVGKINNASSTDIMDHIEIKDPVVKSKKKNAGGLVANIAGNSGKVSIKYTYVYGKHGLVRTLAETYDGKGPHAGGLIGTAESGAFDIQDSGASVYVYADKASSAGGFIGNFKPKKTSTISRCFVGGHISDQSADYDEDMAGNDGDDCNTITSIFHEGGCNVRGYLASGGFVGYLGTNSDGEIKFENCFTTASVSSGSGGPEESKRTIGGFIGQSQHDNQKYKNCYVAGKVLSAANKTGAFIGERKGGNNDPTAPQYDGCLVLQGVGFNSDLQAVGSPAYTPSDASKLKFVDNEANEIKQVNTDSVKTVKYNQVSNDYPYKTWTGDNKVISDDKSYVFCGDWVVPEKLEIVPTSPLTVLNGNVLKAYIYPQGENWPTETIGGKTYNVQYIRLIGETSNKNEPDDSKKGKITYKILFIEDSIIAYLDENDSPLGDTSMFKYVKEINGKDHLEIIIDDISKAKGNFQRFTLWHDFIPGENVTLYISDTKEGLGSSNALSKKFNSLFEDIDKDNNIAKIANSRHLMNLSTAVVNNSGGLPTFKVITAIQTDNIFWEEYNNLSGQKAKTKPYLTEIQGASIYQDNSTQSLEFPHTSSGTMMSIVNSDLQLYDGNNKTIYNINMDYNKRDGDGNCGLFAKTDHNMTIKSLTLVNPKVCDGESSGQSKAILVGSVTNGAELTITDVDIKGDISVKNARISGGVVGSVGDYTSGSSLSLTNVNISNSESNKNSLDIGCSEFGGGVVGLVGVEYGTPATVTLTNVVIKISNIGVNSNSFGGGVVGASYGNITMNHSSLNGTIDIVGKNYAGGALGYHKGGSIKIHDVGITSNGKTIKNTINGTGYGGAGGFIGGISNAELDIKNSYSSVYVAGGGYGVGGFIGCIHDDNCTGTIRNCYASGHTSGGIYIDSDSESQSGRYNVNMRQGEGVGGFIGYAKGDVNIENCFSTNSVNSEGVGQAGQYYCSYYVGGFAGILMNNVVVDNCYSISYISSDYLVRNPEHPYNTGTFAGGISNNAKIRNSYSMRRYNNLSLSTLGIHSNNGNGNVIDEGIIGVDIPTHIMGNGTTAVDHHDPHLQLIYPYKFWTNPSDNPSSATDLVFYGDW